MIQLEGPIVESFYDMSLLSWAKKSSVPLPLIKGPFAPASDFKFGEDNPSLKCAPQSRPNPRTIPHSALQILQYHLVKEALQGLGKHQRS